MSLLKLLSKKLRRHLFTTPTHSQKAPFLSNLSCFYKWDYSEIERSEEHTSELQSQR